MTDRSAFTTDEWTVLRITPSFVAVGVVAADASGLFSSLKEVFAGTREITEALNAERDVPLFSALVADRSFPGVPDIYPLLGEGSIERQMENFKRFALDQVSAAISLLTRTASPHEVDAYRRLLVRVAERTANASREGGFLGFGGVRVSANERAFIESVRKAAGLE